MTLIDWTYDRRRPMGKALYEECIEGYSTIPDGVVSLIDPDTAPREVLRFLALLVGARAWTDLLGEQYEREAIKAAPVMNKILQSNEVLDAWMQFYQGDGSVEVKRDGDGLPIEVIVRVSQTPLAPLSTSVVTDIHNIACALFPNAPGRCIMAYEQRFQQTIGFGAFMGAPVEMYV